MSLDQTGTASREDGMGPGAMQSREPALDADAVDGVSGDPDGLDALLEQAASASPADRIEYRDRIAAYGDAAIAALGPWLVDPVLGGFAERVISRAAALGSRTAAARELRSSLGTALPGVVRRDVEGELGRLGVTRTASRTRSEADPDGHGTAFRPLQDL